MNTALKFRGGKLTDALGDAGTKVSRAHRTQVLVQGRADNVIALPRLAQITIAGQRLEHARALKLTELGIHQGRDMFCHFSINHE